MGLVQWHKNRNTTEQRKTTDLVLTGLTGMALSGIIPRLLATIFGADGHTMYCYFKLFNCSYILFFGAFCHDFEKYVDLKPEQYQNHFNAIKVVIIAQLLGLIFSIRRAFAYEASVEVYLFHYYFTMMFMVSSIELCVYDGEGVQLKRRK